MWGSPEIDALLVGAVGARSDVWVCLCKGVTDHEIRDLLESPLIDDVDDVGAACGAGTGCGSCRDEIRQLCEEARLTQAARTPGSPVVVRTHTAA